MMHFQPFFLLTVFSFCDASSAIQSTGFSIPDVPDLAGSRPSNEFVWFYEYLLWSLFMFRVGNLTIELAVSIGLAVVETQTQGHEC